MHAFRRLPQLALPLHVARPLLCATALSLAACEVDEPFTGLVRPAGSSEALEHADESVQFAEDFEDRTTDQLPSGWTTAWADEGSDWYVDSREGRTVLVDGADEDGRRALIWEEVGELFNPEILMLTKASETLDAAQQWIVVRASGGPGEETGIAFQIRNDGFRVARYDDGSLSMQDGNPDLPVDPDPDLWYWLRLQVEDRLFRGKVWPEGQDEPEPWDIIRENGDVMAPGAVGVGRFSSSSSDAGEAWFDYFAVGAGGEPPPQP